MSTSRVGAGPSEGAENASIRRGPSMADVAALAGVSHQTVSRVLNDSPSVRDETRARVQAVIRESGYRRNNAARMLATNRSRRIGMVGTNLSLHGPSSIAVAVQDAGHERGYEVSLIGVTSSSPATLAAAVERLMGEGVEALVIAAVHPEAVAAAAAVSRGIPIIVVQGGVPGQALTASIDQEAGALLATTHLLELGHRRVVHIAGPGRWLEAEQRRAGWRSAHQKLGRLPGAEIEGDWTAAAGYEAGCAIATDPEATAVFAANDEMAFGAMKALHEHGRLVPHDVSVVGFDDIPLAAYGVPALTTVAQDFSELGRRAVDLTLRALGGDAEAIIEPAPPSLVVRQSTAAPPVRPAS